MQPTQTDASLQGYYNQVASAVNTPQAHVYGVVILINIVVLLLAFVLVPKKRTVGVLMGIIFMIPVALLGMYNIACLIKGHCNLWAWILVIFMVLGMIGSIVSGSLFKPLMKRK